MGRLLVLAGVVAVGGLTGCASTWETVSSRNFKKRPFHTMFAAPEDPLHVLRTSPEGGERAAAMTRLKEPLASGGSQADQDEVVDHILGPAATADPSPVVRAAAIDALSRFQDPRATQYLLTAYYQATGRPPGDPAPKDSGVQQAGLSADTMKWRDKLGLSGPSGFPVDTVALLRAKAIDGLSRTGRPEAVALLTRVAEGEALDGEAPDREARLAAVRGLAAVRQPGSVVALQKVLAAESGKDTGLASRAHAGLVDLTGRDLPPDPQKWGEVVQAGAQVAPEKSGVERAVGRIVSGLE